MALFQKSVLNIYLSEIDDKRIAELKSKIDTTDNEIDLMVYKLYD